MPRRTPFSAGRNLQTPSIGERQCSSTPISPPDLIAVGSHEEHPDRLPTLGSTAERLVRCSPVPVLLCSATPPGTPRSVLLPLDSVDVNTELAEWTGELAQRFDAQLALVHVESTNEDDHLTSPRAPNRVFGMPTTPWTRVARDRACSAWDAFHPEERGDEGSALRLVERSTSAAIYRGSPWPPAE